MINYLTDVAIDGNLHLKTLELSQLVSGNSTFLVVPNANANINLNLPTLAGTLALTSEIPSLNGYALETYVDTQINNLIDSSPGALDTLNELAAALGDDPNFATTINTSLSNRLRVDVNTQGLTLTQKSNAHTNLGLLDTFYTEAETDSLLNLKANLSGATFTGNVGIGITPTNKLHVNSGVISDIAKFQNDSGTITFGQSSALSSIDLASGNAFRIRQGGVVPFQIQTNGNVDFTGNISSTGSGTFGGDLIIDRGDAPAVLKLDSGGTSSNISSIDFLDKNVSIWSFKKDASNNMILRENGVGDWLTVYKGGNATFGELVSSKGFRTTDTTTDYSFIFRNGTIGNGQYALYVQNTNESIAKFMSGSNVVGGGTTVLDVKSDVVSIGTELNVTQGATFGGNTSIDKNIPTLFFKESGVLQGELRYQANGLVLQSRDANDLVLYVDTGGTIALRNGNVAIGQTTATEKLDILGNAKISGTGTFNDLLTAPKLNLTALDYNNTSASVLVKNEVLGDNVILDGGFDDITKWNYSANATIANSQLRIYSATGVYEYVSQGGLFEIGKEYSITYEIKAKVSGNLKLGASFGQAVIDTSIGWHEFRGTAESTILYIERSGATDITVDSISVREVISTSDEIQKRVLGNSAFANTDDFAKLVGGNSFIGNQTVTGTLDVTQGATFGNKILAKSVFEVRVNNQNASNSFASEPILWVNSAGSSNNSFAFGVSTNVANVFSVTNAGNGDITGNFGIGGTLDVTGTGTFGNSSYFNVGVNNSDGVTITKSSEDQKSALKVIHNTSSVSRIIADFRNINSSALTLYGDLSATFGGNIGATNLSGTNTGDQDLSGYVEKVGSTMTGDLIISKNSPTLTLSDTNAGTGSYPEIRFKTSNNQGIKIQHNELDSELPTAGYGLIITGDNDNTQFGTTGTLTLSVLGEIYAGGTTIGVLKKVYHAGNSNLSTVDWTVKNLVTVSTGTFGGQVSINKDVAGDAPLVVTNNTVNGHGIRIIAGDGSGVYLGDFRTSDNTVQLRIKQNGNIESLGGATFGGKITTTFDSGGDASFIGTNNNPEGNGGLFKAGDGSGLYLLDLRRANNALKFRVTQSGKIESSDGATFSGNVTTIDATLPTHAVTLQQLDAVEANPIVETINAEVYVKQSNLSFGDSYINNFRSKVLDDGATYFPNSAGYKYAKMKEQGLLDNLSIWISPTATKLNTLYGIKGANLDFTRADVSTYTDENGMLATAPIDTPVISYENGEETIRLEPASENIITYPLSFGNSYWTKSGASIQGDPSTVGSEQVVNGDFATDTDWTKGGGWTISGGSANISTNDSYLTQSSVLTIGKSYILTLDVISGSISLIGSLYGFTTKTLSPGLNQKIHFNASSVDLKLYSGSASIDNVSVKEVQGFASPHVDYPTGAFKLVVQNNGYLLRTINLNLSINDTVSISTCIKSNIQLLKFGGSTLSGTDVYSFDILADGWYRQKVTRTFTSADVAGVIQYIFYNTSGVELTHNIFGAQLEQKSYATSLMLPATEGSTTTRVAETASKTGLSSYINSEEGVLFLHVNFKAIHTDSRYWCLSDNTTAQRVIVGVSSGTKLLTFFVTNNGGTQASSSYTLPNIDAFYKIAFKYKKNDFALWVNGVEVITDTSGLTSSAGVLDTFGAGNGVINQQPLYADIKDQSVYNTALSDAKLTTLTNK